MSFIVYLVIQQALPKYHCCQWGCCWSCWVRLWDACCLRGIIVLSCSGLSLLFSVWGPSTETIDCLSCGVLSYSGLGLLFFSDGGPSTEADNCSWCTFLFRIQSTLWGPSTEFLISRENIFLWVSLYLGPGITPINGRKVTSDSIDLLQFFLSRSTAVIQHVFSPLEDDARTQFAVPLARIDPICPSDPECHLLRSLLTAVLGTEMCVSARVTLDTEFFCWCYAVQL